MGTQLNMLDQIKESDWHKSTSKKPEDRIEELKKGKTQKERVFELMSDNVSRTSFEVQRSLKMNLNSVRRCLSNLSDEGVLIKLDSGRVESEGKFNHFYKAV